MVAVVDYGYGNLRSVLNALEFVGAEARLAAQPEQLEGADRVILPGVGAFRDAIAALRERGFGEALPALAGEGRPLLGICLGMQLLATKSLEFGEYEGLGLLPGVVERLDVPDELRVPHVGWNDLLIQRESKLFDGFPDDPTCYFVHSYHLVPDDPELLTATTEYGGPVSACAERDNVYAAQFHPEKSQRDGLKLLENFLAI